MHKEAYFSPETLKTRAADFLASIEALRRRHEEITFRPERAALLVLDMQAYFLHESSHAFVPSASAILPNIRQLMAAFSQASRPVVFTRHIDTPESAGMMAKWWKGLIRQGDPLAVLSSELDVSAGLVLVKSQYDAFMNTALEDLLRAAGGEQVVISGVMTHLCCETTARSAFMRGFEVFFTIDATATYTQAFHLATLLNLAHGFVVPVLTAEILASLKGK